MRFPFLDRIEELARLQALFSRRDPTLGVWTPAGPGRPRGGIGYFEAKDVLRALR